MIECFGLLHFDSLPGWRTGFKHGFDSDFVARFHELFYLRGRSFVLYVKEQRTGFLFDLVGYPGFLLSVACLDGLKTRTGHQYDCPCPVSVLKRDIQDEAEDLFFWTRRTFNDVYKEHPSLWNSVILHHIPLSQSTTDHPFKLFTPTHAHTQYRDTHTLANTCIHEPPK